MRRTIRYLLPLALLLALSQTLPAGTISVSGPLTDDASTLISAAKTYSHALSGGSAATVNGVNFELISPTVTPANVNWTVSSVKNQVINNNGTWDVGASGVTGPGLLSLLGSFTYNNDGNPPSNQTFTLSGLTPGQGYETRLYMRKWDNSTARGQTATFTAGAQAGDMITFFEDHPEVAPINQPSRETAWYLSYAYTADAAGTLDIRFDIQPSGAVQGVPGSFHMYGLTNEVVAVPEPGTLALAALGLLAAVGYVVIRRRGRLPTGTMRASLAAAVLVVFSSAASAGTISISGPLTDDASTGISAAKTYTHAISGGGAATINGVNFAQLSPGVIPANFNWTSSASQDQIVPINNNNWVPATGGVTGPGLLQLLGGFTFSGSGADAGSTQQFSLSGLTPGNQYDLRLYIRSWDIGGSGRPLDLTFTNGAEVDLQPGVPEDRPNLVGLPSVHSAYYVNYAYTAQGTTMSIDATVPAGAPVGSGSAHMYGLSNELVAVPEPGTLALAGLGLLAAVGYVARRRSWTKR